MPDEDLMRRIIIVWFLFGLVIGLWVGLIAAGWLWGVGAE